MFSQSRRVLVLVVLALSAAIAAPAQAALPANVTPPFIVGTVLEPYDELECREGVWAEDLWLDYSFQWLRNGTPVETGRWYTASREDSGASIVCRVTAYNDEGQTSADSAPVVLPVFNLDPPPVVEPVPVPGPVPVTLVPEPVSPAPAPAPEAPKPEPAGAPTLSGLWIHKAYKYATVKKSGLRVQVMTDKTGQVTGELLAPKAVFKRFKVKMPKRGLIGTLTVKQSSAGYATFFVKFNAVGKKLATAAMKRRYQMKAKVAVHAHDTAGATSKLLNQAVTLTTKASR